VTTNGSRCLACQQLHTQQREHRRGTRTQRGYTNTWMRISRRVLERDGYICAYCGEVADTADHVIPRSRGGGDGLDNLVAACRACNASKGATLH
jgi:5-methylcytosine-specific restriction endonuclease McrA